MKRLFLSPSQDLPITYTIALASGFVVGLVTDTTPLAAFILPAAVLTIYPNMIGFKMGEILNLSHGRLLCTSLAINFTLVPLLAYLLGTLFLLRDPQLFAGLAIASLLPTSNMTIAFTMLAKGNVPAAVKLTVISLVLGSLLTPWYLLLMVGKYVPVDILQTLETVGIVVFLPLIMGTTTYSLLLRRYSPQEIQEKFMPYCPAMTTWGIVYIIFVSISVNAHRIVSQADLLLHGLLVQIAFYAANYALSIGLGRRFFGQKDALALVFATVLRNLSISIGLAATAFGANAALMVSLAILIQGQTAAWFVRLNERLEILPG